MGARARTVQPTQRWAPQHFPVAGLCIIEGGSGRTPAPPNQTTLIGRTNPVSYLSDGFGLLPPHPHPHPNNGSTKPPPHYLQPTTYCFTTSPPLASPSSSGGFPTHCHFRRRSNRNDELRPEKGSALASLPSPSSCPSFELPSFFLQSTLARYIYKI